MKFTSDFHGKRNYENYEIYVRFFWQKKIMEIMKFTLAFHGKRKI